MMITNLRIRRAKTKKKNLPVAHLRRVAMIRRTILRRANEHVFKVWDLIMVNI